MGVRLLLLCVTIGLLPCTGAQHSVTNFVYGFCNTLQYRSNDSFAHNLNTVVGALTQNASKALYALAKSDSGPSENSHVYAMFQCRGDLSLSACSSCISGAFNICGPALGARGQFEGCYFRYENYDFSADVPATSTPVVAPTCSALEDSSSIYQSNIASALNNSASAAPRHALFGYNASSVGAGSTRAYALTQCLGYVSASQCAACLSQVSNYSALCNSSVSGQVYYDQCFYVFNHTSFLFTTTSTPPSTVPSPAPTSSLVPMPTPPPVAAPSPMPVPVLAPTPAPTPTPSTIPGGPTLQSPPPSPKPVLSPPQATSPASGSQETASKKGNTIISIVATTLVASSLCLATSIL